jgi:hypothetical protein
MDDQNHISLLRLQSAELTGRTRFCPENQLIAEYFDAELQQTEQAGLEHHLDSCRFCLARIGMLERLHEGDSNKRIPESVLAKAKQLSQIRPARRYATGPSWAVAAVLVLAVFISTNPGPEFAQPETPSQPALIDDNSRQLRSLDHNALSLDVLNLESGASIEHGEQIHWSDVPGNIHYNVFILSNNGDVLWTQRLGATDWVLSDSLPLATGSEYFFRVEALLPDGRSVSSRHINFQISGQR